MYPAGGTQSDISLCVANALVKVMAEVVGVVAVPISA